MRKYLTRVDADGRVISSRVVPSSDPGDLNGWTEIDKPTYEQIVEPKSDGTEPHYIGGVVIWRIPSRPVEVARAHRIRKIERDIEDLISNKAGEKRYSLTLQTQLNSQAIRCIAILINPNSSSQAKATATTKLTKILQVLSWTGDVYRAYFQARNALKNAASQAEVDAITWDLSVVDGSDPSIDPEDASL